MTNRVRAMAGELRWMLDPSDPLSAYNRRLATAFVRHHAGTVLRERRLVPTAEGHTLKVQARYISDLMVRHPEIVSVAEIGFNAGHSTFLFLASRPDVRVVSFDLGEHAYVVLAKGIVDRQFPGRHELVLGDSRETVPGYARAHPDRGFDLVFIDGGHSYELASADIANCSRLSRQSTLVMIDDIEPDHPWGAGPARAWSDAVSSGLVRQTELVIDGVPTVGKGPEAVGDSVAWALGRYPQAPS